MSRNVFLSHNRADKITNRVFSFDSPKAIKSIEFGWLNAIHYMAPHNLAGVGNLCPKSSAGCRALCLGEHSGQAGMVSRWNQLNNVRQSRRDKARLFMRRRADYMRHVVRSLELAEIKARKLNMQLCARMNGSTDIAWEGVACEHNGQRYRNLMEAFPAHAFVDYTKIASRFNRPLPPNYHLTFSHSEENEAQCLILLARGVNVAVVFAKEKPATWHGYRVIDGDTHDLRMLDPKGVVGVVIALSPKGSRAKRDKSGFVVR
jgi:hypothetical protein